MIYGKFYQLDFDIVEGLRGFDDDLTKIGYYKVALKLKILIFLQKLRWLIKVATKCLIALID